MEIFEVKRGSTWPPLDARLNLDIETGLTDCTVLIRIQAQDGTLLLQQSMEILDEVTQHVRYSWQDNDTAQPGNYWAEIWATTADGKLVKLPINEYINIVIYEDK